jgi:hypothetical protein
MTHEEFVVKLGKHLKILSHAQAPHSGYHCIAFTATEHQLRQLLKASKFYHFHVAVYIDEKEDIVYNAHIAQGEKAYDLISYLESEHHRLYTELLYMSLEDRAKIIEKLS